MNVTYEHKSEMTFATPLIPFQGTSPPLRATFPRGGKLRRCAEPPKKGAAPGAAPFLCKNHFGFLCKNAYLHSMYFRRDCLYSSS